MTPEEWPIWTPPERGSLSPAHRAGRERLSTVRKDFFLDPDQRLSEQERALMTAMMHRLVTDVAVEIQVALPQEWLPANEDHEALIARIGKAGLLDIEGVIDLLLRRADEDRVANAFQLRSVQSGRNGVQPFVSDGSAEVAAAAMAVLIARGRRKDRYGRPVPEVDDFPREATQALVFAVAAGVRQGIPVHVGTADAEEKLAAASAALLARHDPSKGLDHTLRRLVEALAGEGRADDSLIRSAVEGGDIALLAHTLGHRGGLSHQTAFNELMSGDARRVMTLLRMADVARSTCGHLLGALGDLIGLAPEPYHLEVFDSLTHDKLRAGRSWLALDSGLQEAFRALGHGNGHRSS